MIWVLQEAISQMGGTFSAALFGNGDKVIVERGQRLLQVPDVTCQGGSDFMPTAIASLDRTFVWPTNVVQGSSLS